MIDVKYKHAFNQLGAFFFKKKIKIAIFMYLHALIIHISQEGKTFVVTFPSVTTLLL